MASFFTEKFDIDYYSPEALLLAENAPHTDWPKPPGPDGALPQTPSWIKGVGPRGEEGKWEGRGRLRGWGT